MAGKIDWNSKIKADRNLYVSEDLIEWMNKLALQDRLGNCEIFLGIDEVKYVVER